MAVIVSTIEIPRKKNFADLGSIEKYETNGTVMLFVIEPW